MKPFKHTYYSLLVWRLPELQTRQLDLTECLTKIYNFSFLLVKIVTMLVLAVEGDTTKKEFKTEMQNRRTANKHWGVVRCTGSEERGGAKKEKVY